MFFSINCIINPYIRIPIKTIMNLLVNIPINPALSKLIIFETQLINNTNVTNCIKSNAKPPAEALR